MTYSSLVLRNTATAFVTTVVLAGQAGTSFAGDPYYCEGYARDVANRNSANSSGGGTVGGTVRGAAPISMMESIIGMKY